MKNQVSMKNLFRSLLFFSMVIVFSQCDTEEPEVQNEEELITTVTLTFTPVSGAGETKVFTVFDADGDGPIEPVYSTDALAANTAYDVDITVRNDEEGENITEEILEEQEEHQFFFLISNSLNLDFAYNDADANENPVGLMSIFTTGEPSDGTLTVVLRHEPNKSAEGVINGDITNAGGETDVQAVFDVVIQ